MYSSKRNICIELFSVFSGRDSDEDAKRLSAIDATAAATAKDEDEQFQIEL
jgi:hypothetical protein